MLCTKVEITFPCSKQDWENICSIHSLMGESNAISQGAKFVQAVKSLVNPEEKALRTANGSMSSETPLIDIMAKKGLGGRINMTEKVLECVRDNPGILARDCAKKVSEEYHLPYINVENLIQCLSYSKRQRKLNRTRSHEVGETGRLFLID
jgi:hypothetical protein